MFTILNPWSWSCSSSGWGADEPEEDRGEAAGGGARVLAGRKGAEVSWSVSWLQCYRCWWWQRNIWTKCLKNIMILTIAWYILYHVMTSPGMHWRRSWTARTTPSQCTSLATLPSPSRLEKAKRVKVLPKKATIRGKFEGACFQLQQLNCLARQQAMLLMQLRQRRPSSNCPKFSSPPSSTLNCPKFSNTNIDCVDSVSLQML